MSNYKFNRTGYNSPFTHVFIFGKVDVSVDWGDGTVEDIKGSYTADDWPSHRYASAGIYEVCIAGSADCLSTGADEDGMPFPENILAVRRWGNLAALPESLFADCVNAQSFAMAFKRCSGLACVPASVFDNNCRVISFEETFYGCNNVTGESPYTVVDSEKVHLYERKDYRGDFAVPSQHSECFHWEFSYQSPTGRSWSDYSNIPESWK